MMRTKKFLNLFALSGLLLSIACGSDNLKDDITDETQENAVTEETPPDATQEGSEPEVADEPQGIEVPPAEIPPIVEEPPIVETPPADDETTDIKSDIAGTKWKLVGFVDVKTGKLTEIVPRYGIVVDSNHIPDGGFIDGEAFECEDCYTLTFTADTFAKGLSIMNYVNIGFFEPIRQTTEMPVHFAKQPAGGAGTEVGEPPTPMWYCDTLREFTAYVYYNNALKLYYNNDKNYLLYKLVEQ